MSDEIKKLGIEITTTVGGTGAKQAEQEIKAVTEATKKDGEETAAASAKAKTAVDAEREAWEKLKAEREANLKITDASGFSGDSKPVNLHPDWSGGMASVEPNLDAEAAALKN